MSFSNVSTTTTSSSSSSLPLCIQLVTKRSRRLILFGTLFVLLQQLQQERSFSITAMRIEMNIGIWKSPLVMNKRYRLVSKQQQQQQQYEEDDSDRISSYSSSSSSSPSLSTIQYLQRIPRCGGTTSRNEIENNDSDDEDEEDSDEDDDDDNDFDDDDDSSNLFNDDDISMDFGDTDGTSISANDAGFSEGNMITKTLDAWKYKTPPITKAYLSCSLVVTLFAYLFNNNEFPSILLLDWKKILTRGQVWRLITSFFNFGPASLGYIMTCQFIWVYMSTLERLNHNNPYDFIIMLLFGQFCMIIGYPLLNLSPKFLGHNLSTYLVYIWSRYHEGIEVNMFELFNARAEMLPWFFLGQTFLLEGEIPILDFLGIVFGHIYHHCYTVGSLRAPESIQHWYHDGTSKLAIQLRDLYKPVSADFELGQ